MLNKITGSGFKGASQGALAAGMLMEELTTGGYAPAGYKLPGGENPKLFYLGLQEHDSGKLSDVVRANLELADGVLIFCTDEKSKVEKNIDELIREMDIPFLEINITRPIDKRRVIAFITENKIDTLHVTGKADRHSDKSVYNFVRKYLTAVLKDLFVDYSFGHNLY